MNERTVTALYDNRADAELARRRLTDAGISGSRIDLHTQDGAGASHSDDGFWAALKGLFVSDEDRHAYAEGLRRGGTLLSAEVPETLVDTAVHTLEQTNAVDLDTRSDEWRRAGWSDYGRPATAADMSRLGNAAAGTAPVPPAATGVPAMGGAKESAARHGEEAIPIAEETLRVGKREVERGSVRVRSYVVETPVEEQVRLRDETVRVERRPVERELRPGDMAAFQEKRVEVTETDEEAVIGKTARVKEEVVLHKDVEEHTETVRDTVRHTEVEVEDTRDKRRPAAPGRPGVK